MTQGALVISLLFLIGFRCLLLGVVSLITTPVVYLRTLLFLSFLFFFFFFFFLFCCAWSLCAASPRGVSAIVEIPIKGATFEDAGLYTSERYALQSFSYSIPRPKQDGLYTLVLFFAGEDAVLLLSASCFVVILLGQMQLQTFSFCSLDAFGSQIWAVIAPNSASQTDTDIDTHTHTHTHTHTIPFANVLCRGVLPKSREQSV